MATNNQQYNTYAQPVSKASTVLDNTSPLSYKEWYQTRTNIIPGQEYNQYNIYLTEWYTTKQTQNTDYNTELRLTYLNLLKQLQLFSSNEEVESWYKDINFEDERELLIAIPYFARKLKNIAIYYLQLREEVKKSKIKHNQIGANKGLVQLLQEQLLLSFTKKRQGDITLPQTIWSNVPDLSAVKDTLTITVEELYDDHHYGDQSTNLPASAYYDFSDLTFQDYFDNNNISLSSADWIYKQGNTTVTIQEVLSNLDFTRDVLNKYIGEQKFTDLQSLANPSLSSSITIYNVPLSEGTSFFYWPYGPYKPNISTITRLEPIPLTGAKIENLGTSGSGVVDSDTIFVKTARGVQGAWLRFKKYDESLETMSTYIEGNKQTIFKYPYPGYGLSADDISWTGPSLQYSAEYPYLENNLKELVNQAYWNLDISLSGADPIGINSTTLINAGAYPNEKYSLADKIKVRSSSPDYTDPAAYGDSQEAWLYKMTKTDIPVGNGFNLIVWPYQRINNTDPYPTYFPEDISTVCQPVTISNLNIPYATSSNSITASDVLYRLKNYQDTEFDAIECAWLSGQSYVNQKYSGISQSGLNAIFRAGIQVPFIWEGNDLTDADTVFKTLKHQPDCTFVQTASTYRDFSRCSCQTIYFTPFGHPGATYADYNNLADFIVEQTDNNFIDLTTWTEVSTTYTTSSAFAFYKTNNQIGWGDGTWYSGATSTNNKFYLRQGRAYTYYRAIDAAQQTPGLFPFLVTRYPYNNNKTRWIGAYKNDEGIWISTDTPSNMQLRAGDTLLYKKVFTTSYDALTSLTTVNAQATATNRGSIWATYDYLTTDKNYVDESQITTVTYPIAFYPFGAKSLPEYAQQYAQYPDAFYGNVVTIDWELVDPLNVVYRFNNTFSFDFVPLVTGLYSVTLTAITADRVSPTISTYGPAGNVNGFPVSGYYIFTNIPQITAVDYIIPTVTTTVSSFTRETPGFVINTPLYGWNYNLGRPDSNANGAKPYWAFGNTTYKDVISWGASFRLVDQYNIVTQPFISDIVIGTGNYVEYDRKYFSSFVWQQPINYKIEVNENIWNTIQITTTATSNLASILDNLTNQAIAIPTTDVSPITLRNVVDNQPVEVYYKSINAFVWSISTTPEISDSRYREISSTLIVNPLQPWANLTNRYYPNFAIFPSFDSLYSEGDKGGYFTPTNLGISTYLNKDFTATLSVSSQVLSSYFEDGTKRAGGRSFTKEDQPTPYNTVEDNNTWLKEPVVSGPIAGNLKKNVTRKYQKFIPYQSIYETNPNIRLGLILPTSRQTPWGGNKDLTWTDTQNKPQNFSGVVNVSAWSDTQILKQTGKILDNWVTDIFGNQYGLYKNIRSIAPYERRFLPGDIWVRKNTQFVSPASQALSGVFDSYAALNLINSLTGSGITKIDLFFDTLYIETTSAILFEDLDFNYTTNEITSITDNARFLSLAIPLSTNLVREISAGSSPLTGYNFAKPGDTWFFPEEKIVVLSTCYSLSGLVYPELYRLNLTTKDFQKVFPKKQEDITILQTLSGSYCDAPILSYDKIKNEFLLTVLINGSNICEFVMYNLPEVSLKTVTVYTSSNQNQNLPPVITSSLELTATTSVTFSTTPTVINTPVTFEITSDSYPWVTVTSTGTFTGTPTISGNFYIPFSVTNSVGPTYYSLNITVSS